MGYPAKNLHPARMAPSVMAKFPVSKYLFI
jgi:hypothetical protein